MLIKGFTFGLALQFAVGPICLFVLNTASTRGFVGGSLAATAVTLVDALYIICAGFGLSAILQNPKVARAVRLAGAVVLCIFGLDILLGALDMSILPSFRLFSEDRSSGIFWKAVIMTASNPLTIIFWGGVLTANMAAENMHLRQLVFFGLGCILATFFFLHAVVLAGVAAGTFIPTFAMKIANALVGAFIIYFGCRMALQFRKA